MELRIESIDTGSMWLCRSEAFAPPMMKFHGAYQIDSGGASLRKSVPAAMAADDLN